MKKIILGILWILTLAIAGCWQQQNSDNKTQTTNPTSKTVKIGVIAPLSGPAASIWEDAVNTFRMSADEFNQENNTFHIELIIEDGKCDWKDATSAAQKLVNVDKVKIILWWVCSSETLAASKITEPAGVVLISAVSSSPEISKIKSHTYRYYNDISQAATIKSYLESRMFKKIALVYENTDYGVWFANALTQTIGKENIVANQKFNSDEKDFSTIAKNITDIKNNIDAIIYAPNSDNSSIAILKAFNKEWLLEIFSWKIITNEVWYSNTVVKEVWWLLDWILTTQLPSVEVLWDNAKAIISKFKETYTPNFSELFIVLFKESFNVIADGITNEQYWPNNINKYLQSLTLDTTVDSSFGRYYFSWSDAIGITFVMNSISDWKLQIAK